jgi:glycosyltransferase involved in cell wall biosynthesis
VGLSVLQVSYALAPVSPEAVGGAEQVLSFLEAGVAAAGHRSVVVAPEGSRVAGSLVATPRSGPRLDDAAQRAAERVHADAVHRTLDASAFDLVHAHGLDFDRVLPRPCPPAVVTLHLPPSFYPREALAPRDRLALVCVSRSQAAALPPGVRCAAVVPNGVPLDVYRPSAERSGRALVLARVCREKGIDAALDGARRAGVGLDVRGAVFPYPDHVRYFEGEVLPRCDDERTFGGPVAGGDKIRLLASARCLVVPSRTAETSSLVAMEALACGTPVVARRIGALPEIVEEGRTGVLFEWDHDLPDAIRAADRISRETCRAAAVERFDAATMVSRYLALYRAVAREAGLAP